VCRIMESNTLWLCRGIRFSKAKTIDRATSASIVVPTMTKLDQSQPQCLNDSICHQDNCTRNADNQEKTLEIVSVPCMAACPTIAIRLANYVLNLPSLARLEATSWPRKVNLEMLR
jgi:hypothetical protein